MDKNGKQDQVNKHLYFDKVLFILEGLDGNLFAIAKITNINSY